MKTISFLHSVHALRNSLFKSRPWLFATVSAASIILILILSTANRLKTQSRNDVKRELTAVLKTTQGLINFWKEELKIDQEAIASIPLIHRLIQENSISASTQNILQKTLGPWTKAHGYLGYAIFIKNDQGNIRPFLKPENMESNLLVQSENAIKQALAGNFAIGRPLRFGPEKNVAVTATPIKNPSAQTIGALVFLIDLQTQFANATQLGRMGESGETYAVNQTGQMITPSRFKDQSDVKGTFSLIKHPFSKGAKYGHNLEGYSDYRGVDVVGAWTWNNDMQLGLVTEIDKSEAYRSFYIISRLIWIMIIIVISGMIMVLLFREVWTRSKIELLKQKEETRKELLSIVSHDLRGPLSTVLMLHELLIKNRDMSLDKSRELLEKSYLTAKQMSKLITDLLDSSRIEAGRLDIHPHDCDGGLILRQAINLIEPSATAKEINLVQKIPENLPLVWADAERLAQVFSNLLGNAVKFTPQNGHITAQAQLLDGYVQFLISDTGPGIPPNDQQHLFEPYWQAQNAKTRGTGLGLAICRKLVLAHGGKIWLESKPGEGTTFYFTIPRKR